MADSNDVPQLEALSAPLGALISSVGRGVAEAQRELDAATIEQIRELYASDEDLAVELQRIGYRPTWYHIPEAEAEIAVALSITSEERTDGRTRLKMYGAPLDASYTNRFTYSLTAQSRLKFRVVPVPPSPQAEALVVVPAVVGRTVGDARALLSAIGVPHRFTDGAKDVSLVTAASAEPGTLLPRGTELLLTVKDAGGGKLPASGSITRSPLLETVPTETRK
ncbi:PASTA domain-containing protein [Corallococcus sp. AB049A]|uniref:PASTA domain-containing protein n=1 Tax=Corallococcus interemptor TaxID=2316720 RepID=A0A3A8QD54_9BACT|nr:MULTISPECIES: PASTA domain-containing protein [Corallococcus]RKH44762.1 PASTA domain-containing protein [Corallococcus sp. AB050B]RKH66603.1 PASTA domain-containing protein [Corallococcus interemptor]RKI51195.1 PASTA domain-containing protein [Corallococcus sp. AB049A]